MKLGRGWVSRLKKTNVVLKISLGKQEWCLDDNLMYNMRIAMVEGF